MNMLARYSLLLFTLFVSGFSLGFAPAIADELPEDTNKIESLTPEQARRLVIEFPGMKVDIEVKGAGVLSKFGLPLSGLKSLDAETAKELAGYGKALLVLNGLTKLDAAAAKSLAGFKGATLLDGLTTLDADTAKALAEFKGNNLYLSGLTTLDADTAKALAEFKGRSLSLCGLTTLDANTAEALAEFKGEAMFLTGLTALDADTAKSLAEFKRKAFLDGLTTLDADTAKALTLFEGEGLSLTGLTTLDAETAKALAEFKGEVALPEKVLQVFFAENPLTPETALAWAVVSSGNLSHATTLDHETAKALANYKGKWLSLDGLTTLDAATAKALAEFKGTVNLPYRVVQSFFAKNPLTPETALFWAVVSRGNLSHVTALDTPDSIAIAKALATRKGPLSLPNLKKISPKTLTALIEKQDVEIPLIETLELIQEPDGSPTEDFVIPKWLEKQQNQKR